MEGDRRHPIWHWPHLLGLDAPLVALLWQWQWSELLGVELSWLHCAVLGLGVWSLYLLDRVVDVRRDPAAAELDARHALASRQDRVLGGLGVAVGLAGLVLAVVGLPGREQAAGFGLAIVTGVYFLAFHIRPQLGDRWPRKEISVGIIFAIGTAFFPMCAAEGVSRSFLVAMPTLAGLLASNAILITQWETGRPRRRSVLLGFVLVVTASAAGWAALSGRVWLALGASALLHLTFDATRGWLDIEDRRALIDVCLMLPIVIAFV